MRMMTPEGVGYECHLDCRGASTASCGKSGAWSLKLLEVDESGSVGDIADGALVSACCCVAAVAAPLVES